MLKIVKSKDVYLNHSAFNKCEVEYNLIYRILEDEKALAIQSW